MAKFQCNVISYVLQRTVDITVVVPSITIPEILAKRFDKNSPDLSHRREEKYPVLYLMHGFGNNHMQWTSYTNVELFAEERNIAVVMASAENGCYRNHEEGDRFFDFFSRELPEFITSYFPISDRAEDSYIAGLSMGGYGALLHGLRCPEKYAAIGAFSNGLRPIKGTTLGEPGTTDFYEGTSLDIFEVAKAAAAETRTFPLIYISCGENDQIKKAKEFADYLKDLGMNVTWTGIPGFGHEWRFWNMEVEKFLDWIPRTDSYAKNGKRRI